MLEKRVMKYSQNKTKVGLKAQMRFTESLFFMGQNKTKVGLKV